MGVDAGLVKWGNPSGAPFDGVWPALDGAKTFAAAAQRGTSRPPRQTQLTESVGCWTRRRRYGAGGGTRVEMPAAVRGGWQGVRSPRGREVTSEPWSWRREREAGAAETRQRREAGEEEKPKRLRRDAELRWREAGAEEFLELRRRDAARRRSGTESEEKPKLRRRGDGMRWAAPWRTRREPWAKEVGPTWRLGETRRTS